MESGRRYAFGFYGSGLIGFPTGPLRRFSVNFPTVSDVSLAELKTFFEARRGRYEEFEFLDPGGNLMAYSEDFGNAAWTKIGASVGSPGTDPFGGSKARSVSGGQLTATFCPNAGVSGYRFCVSVYCQGVNPGEQLYIGINSDGSYFDLPIGGWRRAYHTMVVNASVPTMKIGSGSWSAVLFGAQAVPLIGEGPYAVSPGNYGYHQHCRFDTDEFLVSRLGPNQSAVSLPIVEFYG